MSQSSPEPEYDESPIQSGDSAGSVKWKSNNSKLARENARLRIELQKYAAAFNERNARCNNLEVAWRRRGETISKIDIISRLAGTQIMKLLDTLTELRTACQVELQTSVEGVPGQVTRMRHTMPSKSESSGIPINSKSQLIHHVNPMVSGHPIIKPTITLRRLNLQNVTKRPQTEELLDSIEEVDLTTPVDQSSDSSDEDVDVVEVASNSTRMSTSPNSYQNIILPVAEVPLERLSMSRVSERMSSNRSPSSSPLNDVQGQNKTRCRHRSGVNPRTSSATVSNCVQSHEHLIKLEGTPLNNSPPRSNSSASSISVRKYPGSARRRLSEDRRSDINAGIEKCRLVIALKDVGNYLRNGILNSIEQLEEGKVKTGASAQSELKDSPNCINSESQLDVPATEEAQDQTELNFSGIGILNYSAVPVRNDNVEGSSSSSNQEFLNKLQEEDPLEGPSWLYSNATLPPKGKRLRAPHTKKENQSAKNSDNKSSVKKHSPVPPKSPSKPEQLEIEDNMQVREMELTNCVVASDSKNADAKNSPATSVAVQKSAILEVDEPSPIVTLRRKRRLLDISAKIDSDSDEDYIPGRKSTYHRSRNSNVASRRSRVREPKEKKSKSRDRNNWNGVNATVTIRRRKSLVQLKVVEADAKDDAEKSEDLNGRVKRRAAPASLKEPTLRGKLRRK